MTSLEVFYRRGARHIRAVDRSTQWRGMYTPLAVSDSLAVRSLSRRSSRRERETRPRLQKIVSCFYSLNFPFSLAASYVFNSFRYTSKFLVTRPPSFSAVFREGQLSSI